MNREARRARVVEIVSALPQVDVHDEQHVKVSVGKRTVAYVLDDHHGGGRLALCCKAAPGEAAALVESDPERFFVPSYLGSKGWVGVSLDGPEPDWDEVREVALESYRLVASKRLVALLDLPPAAT